MKNSAIVVRFRVTVGPEQLGAKWMTTIGTRNLNILPEPLREKRLDGSPSLIRVRSLAVNKRWMHKMRRSCSGSLLPTKSFIRNTTDHILHYLPLPNKQNVLPPIRSVFVSAEASNVFCIDKNGFRVFRDATIDEHGNLVGFGGSLPEWFHTYAVDTTKLAEYSLIFMMYAQQELMPSTASGARLAITSVKRYTLEVPPPASSEKEHKEQQQQEEEIIADHPVISEDCLALGSWWSCCLRMSKRSLQHQHPS